MGDEPFSVSNRQKLSSKLKIEVSNFEGRFSKKWQMENSPKFFPINFCRLAKGRPQKN